MKISLRTKVIVIVSALLLLLNVALGVILMSRSRKAMKTQIDGRMLDAVNTAADMLDGEAIKNFTSDVSGSDESEGLMRTLAHFQKNTGLEHICVVREEKNGSFVLIIDPETKDAGEYGKSVYVTEALKNASWGASTVDDAPHSDGGGKYYSAYSPVFDDTGRVSGIVTADFDATWYEEQMDQNAVTILVTVAVSLILGVAAVLVLTRQYSRQMNTIKANLDVLDDDLNELTGNLPPEVSGDQKAEAGRRDEGIRTISDRIIALRDDLRTHIGHANTQANNMITAMAADYRAVYHVNLDENDGVCYRADPNDREQTARGVHFPYLERFTWYAEHSVAESYREGFLRFIDPENIRKKLADHPIIAYRYLAQRDGREYYEMIRMAGVRRAEDRDDHIVHAIGLGLTEIDAEMRDTLAKNRALGEALAVAEEANKAKTAFLSSMSHEIRTPMNAIIGLDNLALHDQTLNAQTKDYLTKIGESARHLLGLINDILDMSRIESGRITLRKEEFSFSSMLEQINTMVMSQCGDKGLTYECRVLSRVDDFYIGDDMKLKQVLINILSNAIKFTEAPGSVTLTVEQTAVFEEQATLKFSIRDTGIGMDKEFIPKIFDAFSQEDSSRKNKYGSTGLGMAITKNIVEMMNGVIHVESEKGVGTEFTVIVTLHTCEHKNRADGESIEYGKIRVLIVDDDEIAAEHARAVLDEVGIRADVCFSGKDALQMLELHHTKHEPYNLVLMDWKMPGTDGIETSKKIREHYSGEATVIILTAYNWDEIQSEAKNAGVDGFLSKPLFASNVISEFEHIARRNDMSLFKEKKRASLKGKHILLAEDMEINAEIMMDILEMKEAVTDHAENGRIVVEMFEKSKIGSYDAILMDVRMPEMDGLEAAAAIRALDRPDAKTIPIIALTANAFDEDVQRSLQAGMNAHLSKPVEADHLFQTLEELIWEAEDP
ncbi:MAG: response regulator [Clostridia bacterium]|nr:response regulator [Clostridia bacterium]